MQSTPALFIGPIPLRWPLMLSPMAGFTNLAFRSTVRALGGLSLTTTDLVHARALLELNSTALRMVTAASDDRPLGVQLFGDKPSELRDAARFLEDMGIDLIDINMGCPSPNVTRNGAGAALLKDEELTEELVELVVSAVKIPVTVKMRLGWDSENINAPRIAPRLEAMGVAAVAIHGRTKEQGFTGSVNLEGIRAVVQSVKKIPVIGNGDVHTPEDAARMLREVGCSAVMVGRAALRDPFFFKRTAHYLTTGEHLEQPSLSERLNFMHQHFERTLKLLGEHEACLQFRKVIPYYAENFPQSTRWAKESHVLSTIADYISLIRTLAPAHFEEQKEQLLSL